MGAAPRPREERIGQVVLGAVIGISLRGPHGLVGSRIRLKRIRLILNISLYGRSPPLAEE